MSGYRWDDGPCVEDMERIDRHREVSRVITMPQEAEGYALDQLEEMYHEDLRWRAKRQRELEAEQAREGDDDEL